MLTISRKVNESVICDGPVEVFALKVSHKVVLGFKAPLSTGIWRTELGDAPELDALPSFGELLRPAGIQLIPADDGASSVVLDYGREFSREAEEVVRALLRYRRNAEERGHG